MKWQKAISKVKDLPIYDFHCHLNPKEIYEDKRYKNLTEIWLLGDHYKWRIMRAFGISEDKVTGDASHYEKFRAFVKLCHILWETQYIILRILNLKNTLI